MIILSRGVFRSAYRKLHDCQEVENGKIVKEKYFDRNNIFLEVITINVLGILQ